MPITSTPGLIWELGRWKMEPTGLKNTVALSDDTTRSTSPSGSRYSMDSAK